MQRVYILWDKLAKDAVGVMKLHIFAHDAAAVRFFGDVLADSQSSLARHPQDYELKCVAQFDARENEMIKGFKQPQVIITGEQWLAAQPKPEAKN